LILCGGFGECSRDWEAARDDDAGNMLEAKLGATFPLFVEIQTFQIAILCIAEDLNTFLREIDKKTGKGQPWTIDGRFPNFSVKSVGWTHQLHVKRFSMLGIEFAYPGKR
jgi:hypothetical protein